MSENCQYQHRANSIRGHSPDAQRRSHCNTDVTDIGQGESVSYLFTHAPTET